jgi:hypothetical protein
VERFEKEQTLSLQQLKDDVFQRHWIHGEWHEVLKLIACSVHERKAEELILFLMEQDGRNDEFKNLALAADCLNEVRNRRALIATEQALWQRFVEEVVCYAAPPARRVFLREEQEDDPSSQSYYYSIYRSWDPDTYNPAQAAVREAAVARIARVWRLQNAQVWLRSAAVENSDPIVRCAAIRELARGWKDDPETLALIKHRASPGEDATVRKAAIQELVRGWTTHPDLLSLLQDFARSGEHWSYRMTAVQDLSHTWNNDAKTLILLKEVASSDEHAYVQQAAVEGIAHHWKRDPGTLPWLIEFSRSDEHLFVRPHVIRELARGWPDHQKVLSLLQGVAASEDYPGAQKVAIEEFKRLKERH